MKTPKILALLLAATLPITMFAGCSSSGKKADESAGTAQDQKKTDDPYDKLPKQISVAILDRGQVPPEKGTYEDNDVTKWINENSPVKVKFVPIPRSDTKNKYNVLIAAGEAPDVFMEFDPAMMQDYVNNGSLMEVGPLLDKYGPNIRKLTPPEVKKWGVMNGKEYAIPQMRNEVGIANWMVWIRQDWLDKLNLKMPTTTEELYEVAKAFRERDPDGNGKKDTYGYSLGFWGQSLLLNMFGAYEWVKNADGTLDYETVTENRKNAMALAKRMYDEDLIDKEYFTDKTGSKTQQDFMTNKLGMIGSGTGYINNYWATLKKNAPDAKLAPVPAPKSSNGQFGYYKERECSFLNVISSTCKNPKAAVEYLDWMVSKGWEYVKYAEDGKYYKKDGNLHIAGYDDATWKRDLIYRAEYAVLTNENVKAADYEKLYANSDPIIKEAKLMEAGAIKVSLQLPFLRVLPTANMGLKSYTEKMPNMLKFSDEIYLKAIISGKELNAEQASKMVKEEWDKQGYQQLKKEINEIYKNLSK